MTIKITSEDVRLLLNYDQETGHFTWRKREPSLFRDGKRHTAQWECARWNSRHAGKIAGTVLNNGYRVIGFFGKLHTEHRLAWLWMTGEHPAFEIDHIDGNRQNNAWANLRHATHEENARNKKRQTNSSSGFKGVSFYKDSQKWIARITVSGEVINLGKFDTAEGAHAAYVEAAKKYHGEFARVA